MRIYIGARGGSFFSPIRRSPFRSLRRIFVKAKVRLYRMANVGGNTRTAQEARSLAASLAGTALRAGRDLVANQEA